MIQRGATASVGAQALAIVLSYVFALHLIIVGLANATRAAADAGPQALLDPHAFCVVDTKQGSLGGGPSPDPDHGNPCCTLACGSAALLTPVVFAIVAYAASDAPLAHGARDLGHPPPTAPPGSGRGPRAPPFA
jgi:hypothetical protein